MASFIGSMAGTYSGGLAAGAIGERIGKKVDKRVGAVIGFVAGTGGGMIFGSAVNKLTSLFREDDCIITARLFNAVIINMSIDYFLSEEEIDRLVEDLDSNSKALNKFQTRIRIADRQYYDIQRYLEPFFERIVDKRKHISVKDEEDAFIYDDIINNVVSEG